MATRKESVRSVSLFPFLAVLVCAMGALILLLLVTTRRIRQQVLADKLPPPLPVLSIDPASPDPQGLRLSPVPAKLSTDLPPGVFDIAPLHKHATGSTGNKPRWSTQIGPALDSRKIELPRPVLPAYVDRQQQLDREWANRVQLLASQRAEEAARVAAIEEQLQQQSATVTQLQAQQEQLRLDVLQQQSEEAAVQQGLLAAAATRQQLSAAVDETQKLLREVLTKRHQDKQQRFTILPVDPLTGTTRRPIVIDCRRDQLQLVAEGITLTPRELDGFTPLYNPLAAGVLALARERRNDPSADAEPYVLLIVRPEGMISYYVARLLLQSHKVPFGYELVDSQEQFVWQASAANEVAACRKAIDEAILRRPQGHGPVVSALGVSQPVAVSGPQGEFYLREVDDLRSPGRTVSVAGQRFRRDQTDGSGSSDLPANDRRGLYGSRTVGPPQAPPTSPGTASDWADRRTGEPGHSHEYIPRQPQDPIRPYDPRRTGNVSSLDQNRRDANPQDPASVPSSTARTSDPRSLDSHSPGANDVENTQRQDQQQNDPFRNGSAQPQNRFDSRDSKFSKPNSQQRNPSEGNPSQQRSSASFPDGRAGGSSGAPSDSPQRWGDFTPGSSIGIKKDVVIRIEASRLIVGEQAPVEMQNVTLGELQSVIANRLQSHVSSWGRPPEGFYWSPRAEFIVSPGGARDYESAAALMKKLGIESNVKYVLE